MDKAYEIKEQVRHHYNDVASLIMYFLHDVDYDEFNECLFDHRTNALFWLGHKEELHGHIKEAGFTDAVEQAIQKFRQDHERVIVELLDLKSDDTIPNAIKMIEQFIHDAYQRYS